MNSERLLYPTAADMQRLPEYPLYIQTRQGLQLDRLATAQHIARILPKTALDDVTFNMPVFNVDEYPSGAPSPSGVSEEMKKYSYGTTEYALRHGLFKRPGAPHIRGNVPRSKTTAENPEAVLSFRTEGNRFFTALEHELPFNLMLATQVSMLQQEKAPVETLECIVGVPIAAGQEGQLKKTLQRLSEQDFPHDAFEIFAYPNVSSEDGEQDEVLRIDILECNRVIEEFKAEHPTLRINFCATNYSNGKPTIGMIRGDIYNMVGYDLLRRGRTADILFVNCDADLEDMITTYLKQLVDIFKDDHVDIIGGALRWQRPLELGPHSYIDKIFQYEEMAINLIHEYGRHCLVADAAIAFSMAAYFASGGYSQHDNRAESGHVMRNINELRHGSTQRIIAAARNATLTTNTRRQIAAMEHGIMPFAAWDEDNLPFEIHDTIRTKVADPLRAEQVAKLHFPHWLDQIEDRLKPFLDDDIRRDLSAVRKVLSYAVERT